MKLTCGIALALGVVLLGLSWRLAQHAAFDGHGVVASFVDLWLVVATIATFVSGAVTLAIATIISLSILSEE